MNIVVTGATGFIGRPLCRALVEHGHAVTALTRDARSALERLGPSVECIEWSMVGADGAPWESAVLESDVVVHLAGQSIAERAWNPDVKRQLVASRVETTRRLVNVLGRSTTRPSALICASGINYYGDRGEEVLTETAEPGKTFLSDLCVAWEGEARKAESLEVRVVCHRAGIVLQRGGPLDKILYPFPIRISPWLLGLGGPIASGRQWFPWIHLDDAVAMFVWSILDQRVSGPVNTVAPTLIRNAQFARALGRALHRPAIVPLPAVVLKAVAGGFADELVTSQRAVPEVAEELGYVFRHPDIDTALRSILAKARP